MKNKKGFTLVELISVIVLLSIIITIAILSFTSVKKSVLKSQYQSLVSSIEVAAKKYASETGAKTVFVQTLIDEGYIEADDENKNLYNPLVTQGEDEETDTKILNCYVVRIEDDKASFDESASHGSTGNCDATILNDTITLKYCIDSICNKTLNGTWENDSIKLYIESATLDLSKATSYTWISPLSPGIYENGTEYEVVAPSSGMINDDYEVKVVVEGKEYTSKGRVKIDKQAPYVSEISYTPTAWSVNKTIKAKATDLESGLVGYAITTSNTELPSTWISINGEPSVYDISDASSVKSNAPYYVWVKDKAGNTNKDTIESTIIDIQTIDNIPPECKIIKENENWTKSNVTVIWGGIDKETEVKITSNSLGTTCPTDYVNSNNYTYCVSLSKAITTTMKNYSAPAYTLKDAANNTKNCPATTIKAYVDKIKPSVTSFTIESTKEYPSIYTKVTVKGSDADSGPTYACINRSNTTSGCVWNLMENGTYTGNYTITGINEGSGTTLTLYAFVMDGADKETKAGNISSVSTKSYTLYKTCSNKTVSSRTDYTTCTKACGGGTQSRTVYYQDTHLGTVCPSSTENQSCNTQGCCSSVKAGDGSWSSCNASCGGGTQSYTTNYYSNYNGQFCSSSITNTSTCNNQSCCSSTYQSGGSWGSCSASCGGGTQKYTANFYSSYNNQYCSSSVTNTSTCNTQSCCSLTYNSGCGSWGSCSNDCGYGTMYRSCSKYSSYNGNYCGYSQESTSCYNDSGCVQLDYINGYRYYGCDEYYITTCDDTWCEYTRKNGSYSYGSLYRSYLTYSQPSYCNPDPPAPVNCYLYANCYSTNKFKITSNCTLTDYWGGSCSTSYISSTAFYIYGSYCTGGATFSNGSSASNTFRMYNGVGQYKRTSSWSNMSRC